MHSVESGTDELLLCLKTIQQGRRYISPAIDLPMNANIAKDLSDLSGLGVRDQEILTFLAQGIENEQIADKLSMSISTLNSHFSRIKTKLQVGSTRELVVRAVCLKHLLRD